MLGSNKSRCRELERLILSYKRFSPFMPHARLLKEFWGKKCWKTLGYGEVLNWIEKRYPESQVRPYQLVRIVERLSPHLTDKQVHEIGISKCYELTRLVPRGTKPDPAIVRKAKELPFKDFERFVEQVLLKGRSAIEPGEYINPAFRGLQHAPVNELGIVYLFGVVSRELGFIVETIQPSFPDCLAKERIREHPEKWRAVRIEFEYKTSNFNHPPEGTDIVVCWEHDWPDCPVKRIIELRKEIRKLEHTM